MYSRLTASGDGYTPTVSDTPKSILLVYKKNRRESRNPLKIFVGYAELSAVEKKKGVGGCEIK